jgi:GNAT superfamily N-acetyltransferase
MIVVHQDLYYPAELPGFIAWQNEHITGLVTYHFEDNAVELLTLNSLIPDQGMGTALIEAVKIAARSFAARRLWLVTTNDNLNALRFYQKRGFHLTALYPGAVSLAREIKPAIPLTGDFDIPIRDEIELEMIL